MAVEHRIYGLGYLSPRLVTSEISRDVRELMSVINTELDGLGLKIDELAYEPEKNEWHYYVSCVYNDSTRQLTREVVERYTNGRIVEFMKGKEVGL